MYGRSGKVCSKVPRIPQKTNGEFGNSSGNTTLRRFTKRSELFYGRSCTFLKTERFQKALVNISSIRRRKRASTGSGQNSLSTLLRSKVAGGPRGFTRM